MRVFTHVGRAFALCCSIFLVAACGDPEVTDSGGTPGSGGRGSSQNVCEELFGEDCGKACDTENTCPSGMHCRAGKCNADCGEGFPCLVGECSKSGICSDGVGPGDGDCEPQTCADVDFACGIMVDRCGNVVDCAEEGRSCASNEVCVGNPTECVAGGAIADCEVCEGIPNCSGQPQTTVLRGRVVSPGDSDDDTANQVGIPNAVVYILRTTDETKIPAVPQGLPDGAESCDRCDDQDYGPLLAGAVSDSSGYFEIEEFVPVDTEFLLVVKAGKFRRATRVTVPSSDACTTSELPTALPENPTRLPRSLADGVAVNIPRMAVSTGRIDAMECVFHKMGLSADVFGKPGSDRPIHIYHGANHNDAPAGGAWPNDDQNASCQACDGCTNGTGSSSCRSTSCGGSSQNAKFTFLRDNCPARSCKSCADCGTGSGSTSQSCRAANCGGTSTSARTNYLADNCSEYLDTRFLEDQGELDGYDMLVFDCQGTLYDHTDSSAGARRTAHGARVRQYVNRGGRMFASHLSHTWLYDNGSAAYSSSNPWETGLADVAEWQYQSSSNPTSGTGQITLPEHWSEEESDWTVDNASPRIESFAAWMETEGITDADADHKFPLIEPRSMCIAPGEHTEVFVDGVPPQDGGSLAANRVQQFSFNTPYGAPEDASCGRVAYSGFHVAGESGGGSSPFENVMFPDHCTGDLSDQEKVLLYMLFDLGACVGVDPPQVPCVPAECPAGACGYMPDGCGDVVNCGTCTPTVPR